MLAVVDKMSQQEIVSSRVGSQSTNGVVSVVITLMGSHVIIAGGRHVLYGGQLDLLTTEPQENKLYAIADGWTLWSSGRQYIIVDESKTMLEKYTAVGRLVSRTESAYYELDKVPIARVRIPEAYFFPPEEHDDIDVDDAVEYDGRIWFLPSKRTLQQTGIVNYIDLVSQRTGEPVSVQLPIKPEAVYVFTASLMLDADDESLTDEELAKGRLVQTNNEVKIVLPVRTYVIEDEQDLTKLRGTELNMNDLSSIERKVSRTPSAVNLFVRLLYIVLEKQRDDFMREEIANLDHETARQAYDRAKQALTASQRGNRRNIARTTAINMIRSIQEAGRTLALFDQRSVLADNSELPGVERMYIVNRRDRMRTDVDKRQRTDIDAMEVTAHSIEYRYKQSTLEQTSTVFHESLLLFVQQHDDLLTKVNAVIMGSASAYLLLAQAGRNIDDLVRPNDVDIWCHETLPRGYHLNWHYANTVSTSSDIMMKELTEEGWIVVSSSVPSSDKISKNVKIIYGLKHADYAFRLQLVGVTADPHAMADEFDLSVAKVIYNPRIIVGPGGQEVFVGFTQTEQRIVDDVLNMRAAFLERPWDIEGKPDGGIGLTKRSVNRLIKYAGKGFRIEADGRSRFTTEELLTLMRTASEQQPTEKKVEQEGFYYLEFPVEHAGVLEPVLSLFAENYYHIERIDGVQTGTRGRHYIDVGGFLDETMLEWHKAFCEQANFFAEVLDLKLVYPDADLDKRSEWKQPVIRSQPIG